MNKSLPTLLLVNCCLLLFTITFSQPPSVTINKAAGQSDPTSDSPIHFTVTFNQAVTGFTSSDVSFAGSTPLIFILPVVTVTGGPTIYDVAVSGMRSSGTVVATIPANVASNAANQFNLASTSTDNSVVYNIPPCTITCPANITVAATSVSGAVVNYSVTPAGDCQNIVRIPAPTTIFPVGTTTVNAYNNVSTGLVYALIHTTDFESGFPIDQLATFNVNTASPTTLSTPITITGVGGHEIKAIDFRISNGQLYGLGVTWFSSESPHYIGKIYTIDKNTGVATALTVEYFDLADANSFDIDFDPVTDILRVTDAKGSNLRIDPDLGTVLASDPTLAQGFAGAAYSNTFASSTFTTLYQINYLTDALYIQGGINGTPSPNTGSTTLVGSLGIDIAQQFTGFESFDISLSSGALASFLVGGGVKLYSINLNTGAASFIGDLSSLIIDIAIAPVTLPAPSCSFTVTVTPPPPLTITCPANTSVVVNDNCLGTFTLNANTVSFTGSPTPTISYSWTIYEVYDLGTTQGSISDIVQQGPRTLTGQAGGILINATATNSAGTASCNFNVALVDNVAPVVTCTNRTAVVGDDCLVDVGYGFLVSDNCQNASPIIYSSSLFNDGGLSNGGSVGLRDRRFFKGVYYDTIRVQDFSENVSTCPYTITVEDRMVPVFVSTTCQNITVNTGPSGTDCGAVANFFPVARDNCDGLADITTNIPSGSVFPVGNTPVIATATDNAGNTAQCSFTVTVVDNTPPRINCPGPQTLYTDATNCSIRLPDYRNLASDNCILATVVQTPLVGHEFQPGTYTITVTAVDRQGNNTECKIEIRVVDNIPPTITCPPNKLVNVEPGQCYAMAANVSLGLPTISDACPLAGGLVPRRSDGLPLTANYPAGITTITWKASDVYFNTSTCAQTVTVIDDEPPTITDVAANPVILWPPNHKMKDVEIRYSSDDNCDVVACRLEVSSNEPINGTGDGDTAPDWEIIDDHHVKLRSERAGNGEGRIYTITIVCSDEQGNETRQSVEVRVAHNITSPGSGQSFKVGSTVSFAGTFWDKPGNKHTAKWLIDGMTTTGIVTEPSGNKNGKVTGSYKFTTPGVYKLQMNVTDQNGITSYANTNGDLEAIVVIYDPNGGHTYGGGFYDSPAGALVANPSSTGKASYGFAMNYFKNSTNPKGETQFEFKVGTFEFNALNFDYLVISNSMAQFKGTGKIIGGQSGIGFTMTVTDGQLDGTGVDKVRMKIYNKNNGKIIYDNQQGASDAALPIQSVGSNSIVVISGTNSSLTKSNTTQNMEKEASVEKVPDGLDVIVYPNPASNYFNILVSTNSTKEKIVLQVFDQYGRLVETKTNVSNGSLVRLGDLYRTGVYYVRVIQGKQHKEQKLVKLYD